MSFRPRYSFFIALLVIAAVCVRLGFWQLSRLHQRRAANRLVEANMRRPAVNLNRTAAPAGSLVWRAGSARGHWDPANTVVLRQRFHDEGPGVELVMPLRLAGSDTALLVNRGFVPSPDAMTVDLGRPGEDTSLVRIQGVIQPFLPGSGQGARLVAEGHTTWRRLDLTALRAALPYPLRDVWLLQSPDSAAPPVPVRLRPPPLSNGPHLSYAIQWFGFATIAIVGGAILFVKQREPGKGDRE